MAGMLDIRDQAAPPEILSYGWRKLADLIDLLKLNRLSMYRRQRTGPFAVTAGLGDITAAVPTPITIGTGGTWNTPRPVWIDGAGVIYTAGSTPRPELPMRVMGVKEWQAIVTKGITSTLSRALIYDQNFTSAGYGHIYLYPVPSESFQVVLYTPQAVEEFAVDGDGNPVYSTVIALPPGYRMMLISNQACIFCLGLKPIPQNVADMAKKSLSDVMSSNLVQHMDPLRCEEVSQSGLGVGGAPFDWISGGIG